MIFQLHPKLEKDTHILHSDSHAHLLLHKSASLPWFILVPHTEETELCRLEPKFYTQTLERCRVISLWIQKEFKCDKVNFGAIGNLVPQMHLHIVGRTKGDACWPKPVWGNLEVVVQYSEGTIEAVRVKTARFFHHEGHKEHEA